MNFRSFRQPILNAALLCFLLPSAAYGFVSVALNSDIAAAPRWSATEAVSGRGLADGKISVFVTPNFAENIAIAVTGSAMPQDVADIEAAVQAAFDNVLVTQP